MDRTGEHLRNTIKEIVNSKDPRFEKHDIVGKLMDAWFVPLVQEAMSGCDCADCDPAGECYQSRCRVLVTVETKDAGAPLRRRCRCQAVGGLVWCPDHVTMLDELITIGRTSVPVPDRFVSACCVSVSRDLSRKGDIGMQGREVAARMCRVQPASSVKNLFVCLARLHIWLNNYRWFWRYLYERFFYDVSDTGACFTQRNLQLMLTACTQETVASNICANAVREYVEAKARELGAVPMADQDGNTLMSAMPPLEAWTACYKRRVIALGCMLGKGYWMLIPLPEKCQVDVLGVSAPLAKDHVDGYPSLAMMVARVMEDVYVRVLVLGMSCVRMTHEANLLCLDFDQVLARQGTLEVTFFASWIPMFYRLVFEGHSDILHGAVCGSLWQCQADQRVPSGRFLRGGLTLLRGCAVETSILDKVVRTSADISGMASSMVFTMAEEKAWTNASGLPCTRRGFWPLVCMATVFAEVSQFVDWEHVHLSDECPLVAIRSSAARDISFEPSASPLVSVSTAPAAPAAPSFDIQKLPPVVCFAV